MTVESNIPVSGTDPERLLDTTQVTQNTGDVTEREVVVLADPMDNDARLKVQLDPNTGEYLIQVEDKQLQQICNLLDSLVQEQKETNFLLKGILT